MHHTCPEGLTPKLITRIAITADKERRAFIAPGVAHGLGMCGDPLRPYLDARAEMHCLHLPEDLTELRVYEIAWDRPPLKSGKHPRRWLPISALEAEDVRLPVVTDEEAAK